SLISIKPSIKNIQNLVKAISSSSSISQNFRELEKLVGKIYITMLITI
ncbi:38408_t:CDS:2, partial [Gigaspora margarita]